MIIKPKKLNTTFTHDHYTMDRYSREDLNRLNSSHEVEYTQRTQMLVKNIYDTVLQHAKRGNKTLVYNVRYIYETKNTTHVDEYSNPTIINVYGIYAYDAKQVKNVVHKLKEYFYDASIEFVQQAIIDEDRIYISWE